MASLLHALYIRGHTVQLLLVPGHVTFGQLHVLVGDML